MAQIKDISIDFTLNSKGDLSVADDRQALIQSIKNILFTPAGFKAGTSHVNSIYGVGTKLYLFAPLNQFSAKSFAGQIYRHITMFEPRIKLETVEVNANIPEKRFDIAIDFTVLKTDEKLTFKTVLNQL